MIKNLIIENSRVAFILESPFKTEVEMGYPLAGASGFEVSKYLGVCDDTPLGEICNKRDFSSYNLQTFSIINISSYPMEIEAYGIHEKPKNIELLIQLKKNIDRQHQLNGNSNEHWTTPRDTKINALKSYLLDELITNINTLSRSSNDVQLIPCGKLARVFIRKALASNSLTRDFNLYDGYPHPARNKWSTVSSERINQLRTLLSNRA